MHAFNGRSDTRIHGLNDIPQDNCHEQVLLLEEEDVQVYIYGYRYNRLHLFLYRVFSVLSCGILWLMFRWIPRWYISFIGIKVPLKDAEWLVFEVSKIRVLPPLLSLNKVLLLKNIYFQSQYKEIEIIKPRRELYGGTIGSVFSYDQVKQEISHLRSHTDAYQQYLNMEQKMTHIVMVDYRYIRLVFHPDLCKFLIVG